jgi:hypothetical protein
LPILRIEIPDDLHNRIDASKPEYLDRKGFVCLILDQALDFQKSGATLPTCRAGAGNPYGYDPKLPLQFPPDLEVTNSEAQQTAVPSKKKNSLETLSLTPPLEKFEKLIREFFRLKKGSKSKTAWAHLMGGLTKIQDKYGDAVVEEQLMAAINGRWTGITLKNYEQFGLAKVDRFSTPVLNHPASRVFTAADGFGEEPVTNPLFTNNDSN